MKIRRVAALAGVAEMARQWVRKNPGKAEQYIDKATSTVDKRTGGKYSDKLSGAGKAAKGAVGKESARGGAGGQTVPGATTSGSTGSTPSGPTPGGPTPGPADGGGHSTTS